MNQYEFKKFPILATVLSVLCLLFAVVAIAASLTIEWLSDGIAFLGLLLIVASVVIIAGLTTGKLLLLRVISIISFVSMLIADFVLTIVKFYQHDVILFAIALLMLVSGVLSFVYYLTNKNKRIKMMFLVSNCAFSGLTLIYAIIYMIQDVFQHTEYNENIHITYYFLLIGFAIATALPMAIYFSLTPKDEAEAEEATN